MVAEDVEQDGEQLAENGQELIFRQLRLDEIGEHLHRAVNSIWGAGGEERNEAVEQLGVFIWPVAFGNGRQSVRLSSKVGFRVTDPHNRAGTRTDAVLILRLGSERPWKTAARICVLIYKVANAFGGVQRPQIQKWSAHLDRRRRAAERLEIRRPPLAHILPEDDARRVLVGAIKSPLGKNAKDGTHLAQRDVRVRRNNELSERESGLCVSFSIARHGEGGRYEPGYSESLASLSSAATRRLLSGESVSARTCAISEAMSDFERDIEERRG